MRAPTPARERERLEELHAYGVLDSLPEQAFDDITLLASQICESPIALISLVDEERQWFKSRLGIDAAETHRDEAFCAYAIVYPDELLVVEDATLDERFADNPLVVSDPSIRFYAGAPLVAPSGNALGTICVIDREARSLSPGQGRALRALARQVVAQLELGRVVGELEKAAAEKERYQNQLEGYQKTLEDQLAVIAERSVTDPLTGVRNRRAFMDRLREEVERSRRGSPCRHRQHRGVQHGGSGGGRSDQGSRRGSVSSQGRRAEPDLLRQRRLTGLLQRSDLSPTPTAGWSRS